MSGVLTKSRALRAVLSRAAFNVSQKRFAHDGFASLNIYKDAAQAPKEMDDSEYPDWLWRIQDVEPTKEELLRSAEKHFARGGYDAVFENMSEAELKRLFRLDQRDRIKENNSRRKGGQVV